MGYNYVYGFDMQRIFKPGYIAKNTRSSRSYRKYDENSMGKRGSCLVKGKWDKNLLVVSIWYGGKVCESTYFLLCDYSTTK